MGIKEANRPSGQCLLRIVVFYFWGRRKCYCSTPIFVRGRQVYVWQVPAFHFHELVANVRRVTTLCISGNGKASYYITGDSARKEARVGRYERAGEPGHVDMLP